MKKIRTIIVDDEPFARARVKKLLDNHLDIEIIAECRNGAEALSTIKIHKPDLAFLDIQMPDLNGFEVLKSLKNHIPHVIFVTAYDQYALKAFEVHAVDYLLKPYDNERFDEALQQARAHLKMKEAEVFNGRLMNLLNEYNYELQEVQETFIIKHQGREIFIHPNQVYYFESDGNYIKFHLQDKFYLERMTMQSLQDRLGNAQFVRIHRSFLVNTEFVSQVQYTGNSEYKFTLANGVKIISGRTYKPEITDYLNRKL